MFLGMIEMLFTFFLYFSLAGRIFAPQTSEAAPGVPQLISFQGRLTDTSGNPLGGIGQPYCFRYSVYDAQSGGNKLWPAGTPGTSTTTVIDGVFSDQIGRVDTLDYDFVSTSTLFLQLDVNTVTSTCAGSWETLAPRQQLTSAPYAQTSDNIYGNALRTPTSTKVQVGTGAGVISGQTLFSLDVVNVGESIGGTCNNNNGTMWYNSALSRALVCENNTIQTLSNSSTTIAGIGTNVTTPITAGNVVFSNSNGVSFGQNGSTITASVNAGGGGNVFSSTVIGKKFNWAQTSASLGQNSIYIFPEAVNASIVASVIKIPVAITVSSNTSASRQVGYTAQFGVYTRNATNSTILNRLYSTSYTLAVSFNSNASMGLSIITAVGNSTSYNSVTSSSAGLNLSSIVHGVREFIMPWNTTLNPGEYWFALMNSSSSAGGAIANAFSASYIVATSVTNAAMGVATSNVSNFNLGRNIGMGSYSATSAALPAAISMTQINRTAINPVIYMLSVTQ